MSNIVNVLKNVTTAMSQQLHLDKIKEMLFQKCIVNVQILTSNVQILTLIKHFNI